MTTPDQSYTVPVSLDTSGVVQGAQEGENAVLGLEAALAGLTIGAVATGHGLRQLSATTTGKIFGSATLAAAADLQKQMSSLAAVSAVTGQSMTQFHSTILGLARAMPGGTAQAVQTVSAVQALGLAARSQQPQIRALSLEFTKLGAAVGESAPQMATSFGQLNRELANLDPTRLTRFSDVLTTLHATSGASASAIISFSKVIAPVASVAGLGESSILGLSTAFTKLGDDGGSAATAVNKILTDLNSSVREGSNQMITYANVVGMTTSNFKKLFESNPGAALSKVTQALTQAGPQAPYILQSLGMDAARTQRSLLELSQSGGLQPQINSAINAYGNGSTAKAASASFNNLQDQLQKLSATSAQTGEAIATQLLGPFTGLVRWVDDLARPIAAITTSRLGRDIAGVGAWGLIGGLAAARLGGGLLGGIGKLGSLATGEMALTSGPMAALIGGGRLARYGNTDAALIGQGEDAGRISRYFGRAYNPMILAGMGRGGSYGNTLAGVNRNILQGSRGFFGQIFPPAMSGEEASAALGDMSGLSGWGRVRRAAGMGLALGGSGYLRLARSPFDLASQNATERSWNLTSEGSAGRLLMGRLKPEPGTIPTEDLRSGWGQIWGNTAPGSVGKAGAALSQFNKDLGGASGATKGFVRDLLSYGKVGGAYGMRAASGVAGMAGSAISAIGWPMLAIGAGVAAYSMYSSSKNAAQNDTAGSDPSQMYAVVNEYRDSLGEAGLAAVNLATQLNSAASAIGGGTTTWKQAKTVTAADVQAWGPADRSKVTHRYTGTAGEVAQQIGATYAGVNMTPRDLYAVSRSLYNQGYSVQQINSILAKVPTRANGTLTNPEITTLLGQAYKGVDGSSGSVWNTFKHGAAGAYEWVTSGKTNEWNTLGNRGGGAPNIGTAGKAALSSLSQGILQSAVQDFTTGGSKYATGMELTRANKALAEALKTHNASLVVATEQSLTHALTGKAVGGLSASDIQQAGSLTGLLSQWGLTVNGKTMAQLQKEGVFGASPVNVTPVDVTALHGQAKQLFGQFYGGGTTGVAGMVTTAAAAPENAGQVTRTAIAVVSALSASGSTLNAIATAATNSLNTTSSGQQVVQKAILAQAQFLQQTQQAGMTQGPQLAAQGQQALSLMSAIGPNSTAEFQQGQQLGAQVVQSTREYYQQRLMAQFNYQIQAGRAAFDFNRQQFRNEQDFQIQSLRNQQDYLLQLHRNIKDAESQYYDPYSRIMAKPTWDANDLAANLAQQNVALVQQKQNLDKARADGLSTAAIRVLGLANPDNAQQLQTLVSEFVSDPSVVNTIDAEIAKRGGATAALYKDKGNVTYQRQKQDYDIAVARQLTDFKLQEQRAQQDYQTMTSRMAQDLHDQDLSITGNMQDLHTQMIHILHGQTVDWSHTLVNTMKQTVKDITPYINRITNKLNSSASSTPGGGGGGSGAALGGGIPGGGTTVGNTATSVVVPTPHGMKKELSYTTPGTGGTRGSGKGDFMGEEPSATYQRQHPYSVAFNRSIARAMLPKWGFKSKEDIDRQMEALDWVWGAQESGWNQYDTNHGPDPGAYGIPQSKPGNKMAKYGADWRTNPATQIEWGLDYITTKYGTPFNLLPVSMGGKGYYSVGHGYAMGGIATQPQYAAIGEAGSPEMMIPLNQTGINWLTQAMQQYVGADEARAISTGGQATSVTINAQHYHYDSRQTFDGANMRFELTDPTSLGEQLDKKRRSDNLTASKGGPRRNG